MFFGGIFDYDEKKDRLREVELELGETNPTHLKIKDFTARTDVLRGYL